MLVCWGNLNQIYFTVKLILCKGQKCKNTRQQCQLKLKMNQSSSIKTNKQKKRFLLWGVDVGTTLTCVAAIIALKIKTFDLCWKLLPSRSIHTCLQRKTTALMRGEESSSVLGSRISSTRDPLSSSQYREQICIQIMPD